MQQQAEKFGARVVFDDVTGGPPNGHPKRVVTGAGETLEVPTVILATGSAYKELGLPEEKKFSATGFPGAPPATGFSSATRTSSAAAASRRWRLGDGGSHLPDPLRQDGDCPSSATMNCGPPGSWPSAPKGHLATLDGADSIAAALVEEPAHARPTMPACLTRTCP